MAGKSKEFFETINSCLTFRLKFQVAVDNPEGMRFQVFYSAKVLPYICILDPRTGEEKVGYNGFNKTSKEFERELLKFISKTPYPNTEEGDVQSVDFNVSR